MKESPETNSWIICDGDIDPEWVESLNSVLDDNRLLTMPNGERIKFGPNVNRVKVLPFISGFLQSQGKRLLTQSKSFVRKTYPSMPNW
jgi:hypothetical protein